MHNQIIEAAEILLNGGLVVFPTETVYGLGADANNINAIKKIFRVKGRPINHPLIVHISSVNLLEKWACQIPEYAKNLAKNFWPGPLTLILKSNGFASSFITGGQESIGIRVPSHPMALDLLNKKIIFYKIKNILRGVLDIKEVKSDLGKLPFIPLKLHFKD